MKKLLLILLAAIMLTACSNDSSDMISEGGVKTVSLNLGGDFVIEQLTRSTSVEMAQDIWVFDIVDNKLTQTIHKTKDDSDFTNPRIDLKYGNHDLYIIVSNGKEPNHIATSNTITWETIGDTFRGHLNTNVDAKSGSTLNATLDRAVALLDLTSSDVIPGNAQYVSIKLDKWYYGINYITGAPTGLVTNYTLTVENLNKDSYFNAKIYEFAKEETKVNVTIDASVAYSIIKHSIPNVPLKANSTTILKGNIFTSDSNENPDAFGIKLNMNDTWGTGYNVTW